MKIFLDPWVVLLLIFLGLLVSFAGDAERITLKYVYSLLIILVSGLLGSVIMRKWIDLNEENLIVIRGKLAIRSLKLIFFNLLQTEKRTKNYIHKLDEKFLNYDLIKSNFEEIKEKCQILEEECINSIENWTDVIEEANVKTRLIFINKLKLEEEKLEEKLFTLNKILKEDTSIEDEKRDKLMKQIDQAEFELKEAKSNLIKKEHEINSSILSGMTNSHLSSDTVYSLYKSCPSCGSFYSGSYMCPFCNEPSPQVQGNCN